MPVTLRSRLPQIISSADDRLDAVLRETAEEVNELAKARAPYETGALRDSIHVEELDNGWAVVVDVEDDEGRPYAYVVEYIGHTGMGVGPHAFLTPALEQVRPGFPGKAGIALAKL